VETTRRGFVMLAAGLAAQIPFLSNPGVAQATTAIEQAAGAAPPRADSVSPQNAGTGDAQAATTKLVRPGLAGEFFIESFEVYRPVEDATSFGDWRRTYVQVGLREVRITLVSSGPVTVSPGWAMNGDPVKLYLPGGAR
jgi:hypothetical protein